MKYVKVLPSGHADTGNFLLDVPKGIINVPKSVVEYARQHHFYEKSDLHITLIGRPLAELIAQLHLTSEATQITREIQSLKMASSGDFFVLRKVLEDATVKESIICLVKVKGVKRLFNQLRILTKCPITVPPTHVTLYTKGDERGIGVYSEADFRAYTVENL